MGNAVKVNVDFGINNFYSAKIKEQETLLILFDATGNFLKKFTYNIQDNISSTSAAPKALIIKKQASIGSNREFKIHPNPVTDNLNIDLPLNSAKHAIVILDITGRVIKQVQVLPNQKTVSVNTSNLSSGTYFLKIQSVAENVSLKFMKQ
ncbi:MAG: T9SS type A sorting domain-containing protein [Segetibacter sp.]